MEEGFPLHSGHCCFLQHRGAQMTAQSPRCCPQYHHQSPLVEVVSETPLFVPAVQVIVQIARMGTESFHGSGMCLVAPSLHITLCEIELEKLMVPLVHLYLIELEAAPVVRIELSLLILQVWLFREQEGS